GQGVYAFFLNNKGRIVADMNVLERGGRTLLEMDARLVEPLRATFEKYVFAEQVKIASRVGSLHAIELHGPGAAAVLGTAVGSPVPAELAPLASAPVRLFDVDAILWRDD